MTEISSTIATAVIIAGGAGERLKPLTDSLPKGMVPLLGKPMLYWVIRWLVGNGIRHIVIGVAYRKEAIVEYLAANGNFGIDIDVSVHSVSGGTAEAFRLAIDRFVHDDIFLAMNCDEITNLSVARLAAFHAKKGALVTMALAPFDCMFSVVNIDREARVSGFHYGHRLDDVLVSIGIYVFCREILGRIPATGSIEDLVFAPMAEEGRMAAYRLADGESWVSVNDVKGVREAERKLGDFYRVGKWLE